MLPLVFDTVILPFTAAPPEEAVTVGDWIVSLAVKLNLTTSAGVAFDVFALLEAIETLLRVGPEVLVVTLPVPLVTAVPALPAASLKAIL